MYSYKYRLSLGERRSEVSFISSVKVWIHCCTVINTDHPWGREGLDTLLYSYKNRPTLGERRSRVSFISLNKVDTLLYSYKYRLSLGERSSGVSFISSNKVWIHCCTVINTDHPWERECQGFLLYLQTRSGYTAEQL